MRIQILFLLLLAPVWTSPLFGQDTLLEALSCTFPTEKEMITFDTFLDRWQLFSRDPIQINESKCLDFVATLRGWDYRESFTYTLEIFVLDGYILTAQLWWVGRVRYRYDVVFESDPIVGNFDIAWNQFNDSMQAQYPALPRLTLQRLDAKIAFLRFATANMIFAEQAPDQREGMAYGDGCGHKRGQTGASPWQKIIAGDQASTIALRYLLRFQDPGIQLCAWSALQKNAIHQDDRPIINAMSRSQVTVSICGGCIISRGTVAKIMAGAQRVSSDTFGSFLNHRSKLD